MPLFHPDPLDLLTPFGIATCTERIDLASNSFWVCWPKDTGICFWFLNQEVRFLPDWSDGRYHVLPFDLDPDRIKILDDLGRHHAYWRENINPAKQEPNFVKQFLRDIERGC